jgi:hypothetical protein
MKTGAEIPKRRLHFDIDGNRIWDGADMKDENYRQVLEDWDAVVGWQLAAEAERRLLPAEGPILHYAGIPRKFSRLDVIELLLRDIEASLPDKSYFEVRLAALPPRPKEPVPPMLPKSRAPGSMQEALERAAFEKESKDYRIEHDEWRLKDEEWLRDLPENQRRVRKTKEFEGFRETLGLLAAARATLETWKKIQWDAASVTGAWKFLPPGPWLDYRECWLREWFTRHYPGVDFDFERLVVVNRFKPMAMVHGSLGGAEGYTAYLFRNGKVALESPKVGHALYFFRRDWATLCQRKKSELIHMMEKGKENRVERFIHTQSGDLAGWLEHRLK